MEEQNYRMMTDMYHQCKVNNKELFDYRISKGTVKKIYKPKIWR